MKKKGSKLKTKLLALYFGLAILPVIVVFFFSLEIYRRNASVIEDVLLDYAIEQTAANLSERVGDYKSMMAQVVTDKDFLSLLSDFGTPGAAVNQALVRNRMSEVFSDYGRTDNGLASILLITNSMEAVRYQRMGVGRDYVDLMDDRQLQEAFLAYGAGDRTDDVNIMQAVGLPGAPAQVQAFVYFTYPAVDPITRISHGVMIMEVNGNIFHGVINAGYHPAILDKHISPLSCITDRDGVIVSSPQAENVGRYLSDLDIPATINVRSAGINGSALTLNLLFERGSLQGYIDNYRNVVLVFSLVIMVVFSMCLLIIVDRMGAHSDKIAQAIRQFRETQHVPAVEIDQNDEILFAIADQFNQMSAEMESLVDKLKAKNDHIRHVKDLQRHAEIRALQAQINPHFIYNALDRINWIAIDNGQDSISKMLNDLASLLRYSISNIDSLVPLEAELRWMEKYVYIQSERFGQTIALVLDLHGNVGDFPIYKMLLQPLVENSILHGFEQKSEHPEIRLSARIQTDGRICIRLEDNGSGMDDAVLTDIRDIMASPGAENPDHVGISNVVSRLWYYYGERAALHAESKAGQGAMFEMVIPRK